MLSFVYIILILIQLSERQRLDVERFSDKQKTVFTRDSLSQVLEFKYFPKELIQGVHNLTHKDSCHALNPTNMLFLLIF